MERLSNFLPFSVDVFLSSLSSGLKKSIRNQKKGLIIEHQEKNFTENHFVRSLSSGVLFNFEKSELLVQEGVEEYVFLFLLFIDFQSNTSTSSLKKLITDESNRKELNSANRIFGHLLRLYPRNALAKVESKNFCFFWVLGFSIKAVFSWK